MARYSVLATDGATYGPVDEQGLIRWAHEGRLNEHTLLQCHETGARVTPGMLPALAPYVGLPVAVVNSLANYPSADTRARLQYEACKKNALVAYVLWFFVGAFGAHRFYLGCNGSATAMLVITLVSIPATIIVIGFLGLLAVAIWCFVDIFLIPGMTENYNRRLVG